MPPKALCNRFPVLAPYGLRPRNPGLSDLDGGARCHTRTPLLLLALAPGVPTVAPVALTWLLRCCRRFDEGPAEDVPLTAAVTAAAQPAPKAPDNDRLPERSGLYPSEATTELPKATAAGRRSGGLLGVVTFGGHSFGPYIGRTRESDNHSCCNASATDIRFFGSNSSNRRMKSFACGEQCFLPGDDAEAPPEFNFSCHS